MNSLKYPCVDIDCIYGGPHYHEMSMSPSAAHGMPVAQAIEGVLRRNSIRTHSTSFDIRDNILAIIEHMTNGKEWLRIE